MPDSRTRALSNFHAGFSQTNPEEPVQISRLSSGILCNADAATQNAGTKFPQGWRRRSSTKGCCESLARTDVRCRSTAFHDDGAFFVFSPISGGGVCLCDKSHME
jgi:hypothetical protein